MVPSYGRLATAVVALASTAAAVTPVEIQGRDFINTETKERFQIIGVDYQPGGSSGFNPNKNEDPLTDPAACLRDAALMQQLGINTIRVYNLTPQGDHDECVSIFNGAGIYMILDVNTPFEALYNVEPWTTYINEYMLQVLGVVNAFMNYDNLIGFFAGNEVIYQKSAWNTPAYVRAVVRDMKQYIAAHAPRTIPVGYSAADLPQLLDAANYLECTLANSTESSIDMFGLNSYSWCGDSSIKKAGYDVLVDNFKGTSVPNFFSEYGCNNVKPRTFSEVQAIYGDQMSQVWSGGLVYQWTQDANEYGLVSVQGSSVTTLIDYTNLQEQFNKLDMSAVTSSSASQSDTQAPVCSPDLITSDFYNSWDLPAPPTEVPGWIKNGIPNAAKYQGSFDNSSLKNGTAISGVTDYKGQTVDVQYIILANDATNTPGGTTKTSTSSSKSADSSKSTNAAVMTGPSMVVGGLGSLFMLAASLF